MPLAPWPARLFVIAFTVAVAVCGAFSIEAWPLTGWRLFSHERQQIASGWMAASVDGQGVETPIDFGRFDPDPRFDTVMSRYASLPEDDQEAVCQGWARLVRRDGANTDGGLRLYSTTTDLRLHIGRREPVEPIRALQWTCAGGSGANRALSSSEP